MDFGIKLSQEEKLSVARHQIELAKNKVKGSFPVNRTPEHIQREYNFDKWGQMLATGIDNLEALVDCHASMLPPETIISSENEFYRCDARQALDAYRTLVHDTVVAHRNGPVCELGCGWGEHIGPLGGVGGELTENGIRLGKRLGYDIRQFDFYNIADYQTIPQGSVVFTSQAIEQLRSANPVISGLKSVRSRINCVIHFEPSFLNTRNDELGHIRNRYIMDHDYNRDLVELLQQDPETEITMLKLDALGLNPIHPVNICIWRFGECSRNGFRQG